MTYVTLEGNIKYKIIGERIIDAADFGEGRYLINNGERLGDWEHQIDVSVINQKNEERTFTAAFQPLDRSDRLVDSDGWDVAPAGKYFCDADESKEIEDFCEYNRAVVDELCEIANKASKKEYDRLVAERKATIDAMFDFIINEIKEVNLDRIKNNKDVIAYDDTHEALLYILTSAECEFQGHNISLTDEDDDLRDIFGSERYEQLTDAGMNVFKNS